MKSICYIVPFFGTLPKNFQLWLVGCKANKTVNWIVITDDHTVYDYPKNVKVIYSSYQDFTSRIQKHYSFKVDFSRPWRLALMKPAYGEIFREEIEDYDFWGYCDIDLMWGDIRRFYTDEILEKYDRIGTSGHSSIYRNTNEVNLRYRTIVPNIINFKDIFSGLSDYSFDENGMSSIYDYLNLPYYNNKSIFSHLAKFTSGHFSITHDVTAQDHQMFTWEKGRIFRHHIVNNEVMHEEEMYVHFWCRPMKYEALNFSKDTVYYIYPDVMTDRHIGDINSVKTLKRFGHRSLLGFILNMAWVNRHKITMRKIRANLHYMVSFTKKKKGK